MKRIKALGVALAVTLALIGLYRPSYSADYEVALTTYVPTASATDFGLGAYPNIANGAFIRTITLANYAGATVQTVDLYRTATSSTAATIEMTYVVPASTTVHIDFPARAYSLKNVAIKKSDTTSTVKAQIVYE